MANGGRVPPPRQAAAPRQAEWGPPPSTQTVEEPATVAPRESPEPTQTRDMETAAASPPSPTPPRFEFVVNSSGAQNPTASEQTIGAGWAQVVPGRHEALAIAAEVEMKEIVGEDRVVLVLRSAGMTTRVHEVLEFDDPYIDGEFCAVKLKQDGSIFYFRFSDLEETRKFRRCLYKLQKSLRIHQERAKLRQTQAESTEVQSPGPEVVTSPVTATVTAEVTPAATSVSEDVALAAENEPLIDLDDFDQVENDPMKLHAEQNLINLFTTVLRKIVTQAHLSPPAIREIMDSVIDSWIESGVLKDRDDNLVKVWHTLCESAMEVRTHLHRRFSGQRSVTRTEGTVTRTESTVAHTEGTVTRPEFIVRYSAGEMEELREQATLPADTRTAGSLERHTASAVLREELRAAAEASRGRQSHNVEDQDEERQHNGSTKKRSQEDQSPEEPERKERIRSRLAAIREVGIAARSHMQHQLDADLDTPMGNTDSAVVENQINAPPAIPTTPAVLQSAAAILTAPVVSQPTPAAQMAPAVSQATAAIPATQTVSQAAPARRPHQGLASSRWATATNTAKEASTNGNVNRPPATRTPSAASVRTANGSENGGIQGLGSSRYATKPAAFAGRFTGVR
ncbi:hypothetical protein ACJ41O_005353 [Fusarium nematophilum]